jgi:DNA repair protein RecN (Recombination protein N)
LITRVYLKDCLSFDEVDLEFKSGLNIFTGPSGAGKSILMQSILSLFALSEVRANIGEVILTNSKISDEVYDISFEDEIIIKSIKKDKVRYFLNNQTISKKNLFDFSTKLIKHLNLKDTSEFDSSKLIVFLDKLTSKNKKEFIKLKEDFDYLYKELVEVKKELEKIEEDEKRLEDLKEFAKFEIDKIE